MLDGRGARWERNTRKLRPEPYELPPPEPVKARPAIQIVEDSSAEISWRLTLEANTRVFGSKAQAMDNLMHSVEARDLYKRAQLEACTREAKRRGVVSVSPTEIGL
jgi:hypothetical protein